MMTNPPPPGCFQLKKGIRMIRAPGGAVLLQSNPLRALKINRAAMEILEKCRSGMQVDPRQSEAENKKILPFLDTFVQGGILTWEPVQNQDLPLVSVVIPVYNRPQEIQECLASVEALDYPADKIDVIVVDDGSRDHTAAVVRQFDVRLIVQPYNRGQSAARNTGVRAARAEIIAFLDSDCIAGPRWLRDLVPYFQDPRVALVGGFVDAYYREKRMDRYEQACSALNMGPQQAMGRGENCVFYVPTCNMLVRKDLYLQAGGLDDRLQVGEDVDLCWRLMAAGHHLLYIPRGAVAHKHRNRLLPGLLRRFDYGTSEAVLYARFPKVAKQFPWQPTGIAMILIGAAALVTQSWPWLVLLAVLPTFEAGCKWLQLVRKFGIRLPVAEITAAVLKSHFQLAYYLSFYMVRYHLPLLVALACAMPSGISIWLTVVLLPGLVTYLQKRPRLSFPVFLFFYLAEHAFYQCGAFWGCLKQRRFRLYRIVFRHAGFLGRTRPSAKTHSGGRDEPSKEAMSGSVWRRRKTA
jgi:mycofactocin system glycosyltransferase